VQVSKICGSTVLMCKSARYVVERSSCYRLLSPFHSHFLSNGACPQASLRVLHEEDLAAALHSFVEKDEKVRKDYPL
jgi:hypothetical protein